MDRKKQRATAEEYLKGLTNFILERVELFPDNWDSKEIRRYIGTVAGRLNSTKLTGDELLAWQRTMTNRNL